MVAKVGVVEMLHTVVVDVVGLIGSVETKKVVCTGSVVVVGSVVVDVVVVVVVGAGVVV